MQGGIILNNTAAIVHIFQMRIKPLLDIFVKTLFKLQASGGVAFPMAVLKSKQTPRIYKTF